MRRACALGSVVTLLWTLLAASPAQATYPGTNGRLAYTFEKDGIWQIFSMDPDGTDIEQITHFRKPQSTGGVNWSPDGTKIAFDSDRTGEGEIWTINADGSGLTRITHDPTVDDSGPVWSPDATQIVFTRESPRTGNGVIYRIDADGTGMTKLTTGKNWHEGAQFTTDGSQIVYLGFGDAGGICELWTMNPDGSDKTLLVPADARLGLGDLAPDGTTLLVFDNCAGPAPQSIYRMNFDGSGMTQLTDAGCCYQDGWPQFSPDGTQIVFMSNRVVPGFDVPFKEMYVMDADGSNLVQITSSSRRLGAADWGVVPT